jgi:hypothetical protein
MEEALACEERLKALDALTEEGAALAKAQQPP